MELKKDLLKKDKKSIFRIILGVLQFTCVIVWLTDTDNHLILRRPFNWIFLGCLVLSGILYIIDGFGFAIGKAFIFIDKEIISIKIGVFDKKQSIVWNDIKSINYKINNVEIIRSDNSSMTFNIKSLGYSLIKNIKQVISGIASEKGITINE